MEPSQSLDEMIISVEIFGMLASRPLNLGAADARLGDPDDSGSDLVLHLEHAAQLVLEQVRPHHLAFGVRQPDADAQPPPLAPHAAFHDIGHAQRHCRGRVLQTERGPAGHHGKSPETRQCRDDVVGHAIGEKGQFGIGGQVGKGQHGDRGPEGPDRAATWPRVVANQAIAYPRDGVDRVDSIGQFPHHLAQSGDLNRKIALLDHKARPDRINQFGPGDHFAPCVGKCCKDRGPPPSNRDKLMFAVQDHAHPVKGEGTETHNGRRLHDRTHVLIVPMLTKFHNFANVPDRI